MLNIALFANCHVQPIASGLLLSKDIGEVIQIPLHLKNTSHFDLAIKALVNSSKKFIGIQFPGSIDSIENSDEIKAKLLDVFSFTNVYFTGVHPDMTYIGSMRQRILSPLGDYHSKICLASYLSGVNANECINNYNYKTYQKLNFFENWHNSKCELLARDEFVDIKIAGNFIDMTCNSLTLFTFNHPVAIVFHKTVNDILEFIKCSPINFSSEYFNNYLSSNAWWPIYKEIQVHNALPYSSNMEFKSPDGMGGKIFTLEEFVKSSYESYEKVGKKLLSQMKWTPNLGQVFKWDTV